MLARLREDVRNVAADAVDEAPLQAERAGVQHRRALGRLPEEGLHTVNAETGRSTIRRPHDVEARARCPGIAGAEVPVRSEVAREIGVPRLDPAELVERSAPLGLLGGVGRVAETTHL